jgi:hypothetical protein
MVTDWLDVPPALVAVQVSVVAGVSVVMDVGSQPLEELIGDSSSTTVQVTVTSLVYHPLSPSVPAIAGVIAGAVESVGVAAITFTLKLAGARLNWPPVSFLTSANETVAEPAPTGLTVRSRTAPHESNVTVPGETVATAVSEELTATVSFV